MTFAVYFDKLLFLIFQNIVAPPKRECNSINSSHNIAKVLLSGPDQSRKSTMIRHIRILYGANFREEEILYLKHLIRSLWVDYFTKFLSDYSKIKELPTQRQDQCRELLHQLLVVGIEIETF